MTVTDTNSVAKKRQVEGVVVRRSGAKTISVQTATTIRHPLYRKSMKRTKRYLVHDPKEQAAAGDTVIIREARPLSARKRWVLVSISHKASVDTSEV
ncbi:MAG: 30S ribosomal protein S17 [Candidatus Andersenbacteria bacterium]